MSEPVQFDLVGTGSMVVDRICSTPRMIGAEEKVLLSADAAGRVVQQCVGGVMLNQLGWARLFGMSVAIFGKLAEDSDGDFLRAGMRRIGIEPRLDLSGGASSFAQVYVDGTGGRAIYMARGATAELRADEIDSLHRPLIESAAFVSTEISQVPLDVVVRVLEIANAAGATTVLDVDVPLCAAVPVLGSEAQLHAALERAALIKGSPASFKGLVEASGIEELAKQLERRYAPSAVILTLGAAGSAVFADGVMTRVSAAAAALVDSTGAGDAFLGGLLAGRQRGLDWPQAARLGNACGAACCERTGAFPDDPAACLASALEHYAALGGTALTGLDAPAASAAPDALESFLGSVGRVFEAALVELDRSSIRAAASLIREAIEAGCRTHVTGVGKPAHVAQYAASLLASTGTPATFLHGTEAAHGSSGQVCPGDVVIAISNSGTTAELLRTVDAVRGIGARVIGVTADANSPLAAASEWVLLARAAEEGGPLGLAPRASVLVEVLVLAALSVELQAASGFSRGDYHARHPGGALGRRSETDD